MNDKNITKRVSLDFPGETLKQIDEICKKNFISKRKWFIDAAIDKLEKERGLTIDSLARGQLINKRN